MIVARMESSTTRSSGSAPPRHPGIGLRIWLLFALLTIVATYPLPFRLGSHLLGTGPDPDLFLWILGWNAHAFLTQPLAIFGANIFYPANNTLAYSENLVGNGLLIAPWIWLTGDLVSASNLVQLASVFLSATGAYLLARRLGLSVAAAIVAGVVCGFAPARLLRMPQIHVSSIHWIPWCLAYLHTYFGPGGRPRDLRIAVAFFALQTITSGHAAVFLVVAVALTLLWRFALGEPLAIRRRLGDLGWPGAVALLPAVWCYLPYRAAQADVGNLARTYEDVGISVSSYLSAPSRLHEWLWQYLPTSWTTPAPEANLFPGVIPIAMALVAVVAMPSFARKSIPASSADVSPKDSRTRWRNNPVALYALILAIAIWFVIGPPFGLWRWTYSWPVFSFMRVPTRFVMLEILALAILSGFGFEWLRRKLSPTTGRAVTMAVFVLLAAEFTAIPLATEPYQVRPASADRWLASRPKPFAIAEVPVPDSLSFNTQAVWETRYMLHATAHWQKTVHGYSGVEPAFHSALMRQMITFPDEPSLSALAGLGVDYVVMHPRLYQPEDLPAVEARIAQYRDWLKLEYSSADGRVYSLRRP